ncbi:MAG: Bud13/CWC26 family protein, partial [Promethearchaeia archaeon]
CLSRSGPYSNSHCGSLTQEASKPFARTIDDKELNAELKQVSRWGDPMAGKLQGKTASNRPKYRGPFPPNRYGIAPGYRWDGVDRSNGFERSYFATQNARQISRTEGVMELTADM